MKKVIFIGVSCILLLLSSCMKNSAEYKSLVAENDSLRMVNSQAQSEMNEMLGILNEVEDNFKSIKEAENYLTVQSTTGGELTPSTRDRLASDMKLITETLNKNKESIAALEKQLKNSNIQSAQLKKTIERLRNELNEKTMALVAMQAQMAEKDQQIADLSESVMNLSTEVQSLKTQADEHIETISKQEKTIKSAFYCFGTSKELKDQNILKDGQLGTNFNNDYFIKIKNIDEFSEIELFAKKAKLITKHPEGSYELQKTANEDLILKITHPQSFWSLGKYLVIEVK